MNIASLPLSEPAPAKGPLELDHAALQRVHQQMQDGAVTPAMSPWAADIVRLLNGALATELVCVLRYKRHHFTATGLNAPAVAAEFMVHANEEAGHADRLAARIVQLGGEPDFSPEGLLTAAMPPMTRRSTSSPCCAPTFSPSGWRSKPTAR